MTCSGVAVWLLALAFLPAPLAAPHAASLAAPDGSSGTAAMTVQPTLAMTGIPSPMGEVCSATALCPATVRTAYNVTPLLGHAARDGAGQSIVVVDACGDAKIASDLATFDSANGLPKANLTVYYPQGSPCGNSAWSVETSLDVEWAHVISPAARLHLVVAARPTNADLFAAWNFSLANALGAQFSDSWAGNGACPGAALGVVQRAESLGVTVLASSGDGGRWGIASGVTGAYPADCAPVLTVGGTTLAVNATTGAYVGERAWFGSGGGYAANTTEKAYQSTVHIHDPYGTVAKPDVAALADPATGVWVYNEKNGGWSTVGGTSVACPVWAGLLADANSWRSAQGFSTAGFLNAFLYTHIYAVNGTGAQYPNDFHDVASGSNGWPAGRGWDAATGLGSFNGFNLARTIGTSAAA